MRLVLVVLLAACTKPSPPSPPDLAEERVSGLGTYHRQISCGKGQGAFDDGLRLFYAFDVEAAEAAFRRAATTPCAIAEWGTALSLGPNINTPSLPERRAKAREAIARAQALRSRSDVEQGLIDALASRYEGEPTASDRVYAARMRALHERFPDDPDVAALTAAALLDLHPFAQWTPDGKPNTDTPELVALLERAREKHPEHPGLAHYYVHAMESSPTPGKALDAARAVSTMMPGAGHLVHMPSHVFLRTGEYEQAAEWNRRAIAVDAETQHGPLYAMYTLHDHHFLWMALLWLGKESDAQHEAKLLAEAATPAMVQAMPGMEPLLVLPSFTRVRFSDWQGLLELPPIAASTPFARAEQLALWIRAEVQLELPSAAQHLAELERLVTSIPADRSMGANTARAVLAVALDEARSEVHSATGKKELALAELRRAVVAEDSLEYDEPPSWPLPVRERLAERLVDAKYLEEAKQVLAEDLERHPNNRWAKATLDHIARKR